MEETYKEDAFTSQTTSEGKMLYYNFVFMSIFFSANHGSVTSVIALASSFEAVLGSYSVGVLYGCYVLTAMLAGPYIVSKTSAKKALIFSLALYAIYVASYLIAVIFPASAWPAVLFGASIGGIGAGLLWTAQGSYFKINAMRYATAVGITEEEATGLFSSTFAAWYLGLEVVLKVSGSLVARYGSDSSTYTIYALYSAIAVGSTILMTRVLEMVPMENVISGPAPEPGCGKITAALTLLFTNAKCALMVPTNVAFGFAAAFITAYVGGSVVAPIRDVDDDDDTTEEDYHSSQVLLYSSLAVAVATFLALPGFGFHALREKAGTPIVMFIGAACFVVSPLISLVFKGYTLRHLLWLLYTIYGAGRSVWESTVKAIFADFFNEEDSQAAFANIILQSGTSSTIAFFVFPGLSGSVKGALVIISASLGFVCFVLADQIHARDKEVDAENALKNLPPYKSLDNGERA